MLPFYHEVLRYYFINVFAFLQVKANLKEVCEEISFLLFSEFFPRISRLIVSKKCVTTPYFFVDSSSPCKDLLFPHDPNLVQKNFFFSGKRP